MTTYVMKWLPMWWNDYPCDEMTAHVMKWLHTWWNDCPCDEMTVHMIKWLSMWWNDHLWEFLDWNITLYLPLHVFKCHLLCRRTNDLPNILLQISELITMIVPAIIFCYDWIRLHSIAHGRKLRVLWWHCWFGKLVKTSLMASEKGLVITSPYPDPFGTVY